MKTGKLNRATRVEWMVRTHDRFGDTIDVEAVESLAEATAWLDKQRSTLPYTCSFEKTEIVAASVERREWFQHGTRSGEIVWDFDEYGVATCGDVEALREGGWIE